MKTPAVLIGTIAPATAFAASSSRVDNSGLFEWGFVGICVLIIVAQIAPAIMRFLGMAKGLYAKPPK